MGTVLEAPAPTVIEPTPRPRGRAIRGIAMLLGGFVLIAFLGGVIVKRFSDGVTIGRLAGLAAGVGGTVLVVRGWQVLLRPMRRRWARALVAVLGTLVVAQFVLLPAVMALDATHRLRATGTGRTPADLGLAFEDVRFETADGLTIAGWWLPAPGGAAVVVLPGAGSTREAALDHAALLARAGIGALVLDLRGHGDSEGSRNEFGWGAERDVTAAVDWLEARPDVTGGIGVLGLSMGGEVALTAAALDPRIDAVVAEGASARTWADVRGVPSSHPVSLANAWLMFGLVDILSAADPPIPMHDAVTRIDAPVLLIMGDDEYETKLGPIYHDTNPDAITLWALPDTPHIAGLRVHPDEYRERLLAAFDRL